MADDNQGLSADELALDDAIQAATANPDGFAAQALQRKAEAAQKEQEARYAAFADQPEIAATMREGDSEVNLQIEALDSMLTSQGMEVNAANRAKANNSLVQRIMSYEEDIAEGTDPYEVAPVLTDPEFVALNIMAKRAFGKSYTDPRDLEINFVKDANSFVDTNRQAAIAAPPEQPRKVAVRDGVVIADTADDPALNTRKQLEHRALLDQIPDDPVWGYIAEEMRQRSLASAEEQAAHEERAFGSKGKVLDRGKFGEHEYYTTHEVLEDNKIDLFRYRQSSIVGKPGLEKTAYAANIFVPLYDDPTGRTEGIDLPSTKSNLVSFYVRTGYARDPERDIKEIRKEARKKADEDIARIVKKTDQFVYMPDDTEAEKHLDGKTPSGWLGQKIPALAPILYLFINERQAAGEFVKTVTDDDGKEVQVVSEAFRPGGLEFLTESAATARLMTGRPIDALVMYNLANSGFVRGADSFIRFSTSEVLGAAFHLARKDYLREFGPADTPEKREHRAEWIRGRIPELWYDPRLALEVSTGIDNSGRLLTEWGEIMGGQAGYQKPFWANLSAGSLSFLFMLTPFDLNPISFLPYAIKAVKGTVALGSEARTMTSATNVRRLSGENTQYNALGKVIKKIDDSRDADGFIDPIEAEKILRKETGINADLRPAQDAIIRDTLADLQVLASKSKTGEKSAFREAVARLQYRAQQLQKTEQEAVANLQAARAMEAGLDRDRAILGAVRQTIKANREKLDLFEEQLQAARLKMLQAQDELEHVRALDALTGPKPADASKAERAASLEAGREQFARMLKSGEFDDILKQKNIKAGDLLDEMDDLYSGLKRSDPKFNGARAKFMKKLEDFVLNDMKTAVATREAALIARINESLAEQSDIAGQIKNHIRVIGTQGISESEIMDQLRTLLTMTDDSNEFQRLMKSVNIEIARAEKGLLRAEDTVKNIDADVKLLAAANDPVGGLRRPVSEAALRTVSDIMYGHMTRLHEALGILRTVEGQNSLARALNVSDDVASVMANPLTKEAAKLRSLGGKELAKLSDQEFLSALLEGEITTLVWSALPELNKGRMAAVLGISTQNSFLSQASNMLAWAGAQTKFFTELFPIFRQRISLIGDKYAKEIVRASNNVASFFRVAETDLYLIATRAPKDQIHPMIVQYLGGSDRLYLGGRNIPVPAHPLMPKNKRFELTGNIGMGETFIDLAIRNMAGAGRAYLSGGRKGKAAEQLGKSAAGGDEVSGDIAASTLSLRGFVYSFIDDAVGGDHISKANKATVEFARALAKEEADLVAITDPAIKFRRMQDMAIAALKKVKAPLVAGGKVDDLPARELNLSYRSILAGAQQQKLADDISNSLTRTITMRNARAYRILVEGSKARGMSSRSTIEIGDMVVLNSDMAPLRRLLFGKGDYAVSGSEEATKAAKAIKRAEKKRGPTSPVVEAEVAERMGRAGLPVPISRRVEKIEEVDGVTTAFLFGENGVEKVPLAELSKHEPEMSWLDFIDTMYILGPELIQSAYRVKFREKLTIARNAYARMVVNGRGPDGRIYMAPANDERLFGEMTKSIVKDLNVNLAAEKIGSPLAVSASDLMKRTFSQWRAAQTIGILGDISFAFFVWSGDTLQMLARDGVGKAAIVGGVGGLGYIPVVGPVIQDVALASGAALSKASGGKFPLPLMFTAVFNEMLDDIYKGVNQVKTYKLANGRTVKINPAEVRHELNKSPLESGFRGEDWFALTERIAKEGLQKAGPALVAQGYATQAKEGGKVVYKLTEAGVFAWRETVDVALRAGNRRQRELFMIDEVFNKGRSWNEARDNLAFSIYDYQKSVGPLESRFIASWAAFYTYTKNFLLATMRNMFSGSDDLMDYTKKMLKMQTPQQRIMAMTRFADVIRPDEYIDPEQELTKEEARRLRAERQIPYFYQNYLATSPRTLGPKGRELARELKLPYEQYMYTFGSPVPAMEGLSILNEVFSMVTGLAVSWLREDAIYDSKAAATRMADGIERTLIPPAGQFFRGVLNKISNLDDDTVSMFGAPLSAQEVELIEYIDRSENFVVKEGFEALQKARIAPKRETTDTDPRIRSRDLLTNLGLFKIAAQEFQRLQLFATLFYGVDSAPDAIKILLADLENEEDQDRKAKAIALLQIVGVLNLRMWRGDQQQGYRVSDIERGIRKARQDEARDVGGDMASEARVEALLKHYGVDEDVEP